MDSPQVFRLLEREKASGALRHQGSHVPSEVGEEVAQYSSPARGLLAYPCREDAGSSGPVGVRGD